MDCRRHHDHEERLRQHALLALSRDCGPSGNERPTQERGPVLHDGKTPAPRGVDAELHPDSPRDPGYRVPRILVDQNGIRPIDLAIVDGVETVRGGEGPWLDGLEKMTPGVIIAGRNAVNVDAVGMAVMSYDPYAERGHGPSSGATTRYASQKKPG